MITKNAFMRTICGIILLTISTSCTSVIKSSKVSALTNNYCSPNIRYDFADPRTVEFTAQDNEYLKKELSEHDYTLCKATGLLPALSSYVNAKDTLQALVAKQNITDRFLLATTELEAISAELDCNGERIDQLASYLDNINSNKTTKLTVASIALGALTVASSAIIKNNSVNNAVNITGGAAAAAIGFMTLNPKGKKVEMYTHRNMLKNIWYNDNSDQTYPQSLWHILTEKEFSNSKKSTLIETIKSRWVQYNFGDGTDPTTERMFFKDGGIYTAGDLHTLSNMYNELQATIRGTQQDMRSLILKINSLKPHQ